MQIIKRKSQQFQLQEKHRQQFDLQEDVKPRKISHCCIKKACINYLNCSYNPERYAYFFQSNNFLKFNLQRINLSGCNIKNLDFLIPKKKKETNLSFYSKAQINSNFSFLNQLIVDDNQIKELPSIISNFNHLRTLSLNNNFVTFLPAFQNLWYLYAKQNPINLISLQLRKTKLREIKFDWLDYINQDCISQTKFYLHYEESYYKNTQETQLFIQILKNIYQENQALYSNHSIQNQNYKVRFTQFFTMRLKKISSQQQKINFIIYLLRKAIFQQYTPFIQFCYTQAISIPFNKLQYKGTYLLQYVLEENYQQAIGLFMQNSQILESCDQIYIQNLVLACKYSNYSYFNYLIKISNKTEIIEENISFLISQIFLQFSTKKLSHLILDKLIKQFQNNRLKILIPFTSKKQQNQNIGAALAYIIQNKSLFSKFDFQSLHSSYSQIITLLQFASSLKNSYLLEILLFYLKFNIFSKNIMGKTARMGKCSFFNKKIIISREKYLLKKHFYEQKSSQTRRFTQNLMKKNNQGRKVYLQKIQAQPLKKRRKQYSLYAIQQNNSLQHLYLDKNKILKQQSPKFLQNLIQKNPIAMKTSKRTRKSNIKWTLNQSPQIKKKGKQGQKQQSSFSSQKPLYLDYYQYIEQQQNLHKILNEEPCKILDQYQILKQLEYLNFIEQSKQKNERSMKKINLSQNQTNNINMGLFCYQQSIHTKNKYEVVLFSGTCCKNAQNMCINLDEKTDQNLNF